MLRRAVMRSDEPVAAETRRRRWLGLLASLGGTLLGVVTSLYSAEVRAFLEAPFRATPAPGLAFAITALTASVSSVLIYELALRHRRPGLVAPGAITIRADVLDRIPDEPEPVVGRSLRYLECRRYTSDLVVFLHGLGLDADDFRPYLAESTFHCVALTLYGFNADERDNPRYRPISLTTHVRLVGYALRKLRRAYPHKRLTLVGFSFGADILLALPELDPGTVDELRPRRAVLLDPNVNTTTTTISSRIAEMRHEASLRDLEGILRQARNVAEFRYRAAYLSKISSKNFGQVHRHARELSARYRQRSFGPFLDWVGRLHQETTDGVHVILSHDHEEVFTALVRAAASRGLDVDALECAPNDHFDLIRPGFLQQRLERLV